MGSVIVFAFDGLQPSQIAPERMPNLHAFASEGVTFGDHHAVFPTVTRANVVSMLTGTSPGAHGLTANTLVMRDFDDTRVIPAMAPELARVQQAGELLLSPHLADILATHGRRSVAIGTGTSGNAFLQSPNASRSGGATVNPGFTNPPELQEELTQRFGAWPDKTGAGGERLAHAVTLLTEHLIPKYEPAVAVFWSNQPDSAQHAAGVGSDLSELVVAIADRQFGRLLVWLEATGRAAETDVVVISDHGYSTLADSVDVEALLRDGLGAEVGRTMLVAPNGGAVLFYVRDSDPAVIDHLAGWLMAHPWCGAVAASEAAGHVEGTVPAALVGIEGPRAPDLAMSFAWESRPNEAGFEGTIAGKGRPGIGQHGSMSRHEMRCVLTARGPSFGAGLRLDTPSGHVDLAPTLLRVLDLPGGEQMHGRVLEEALVGGPSHEPVAATKTLKAERVWRSGSYRQAVTVTRVGDTTYVDEGNRVAEGKTT